jgi:microcystin-dependent protein
MPRTSSGVYVQPASDVNPPISGTVIDPVAFAAALTDISAEITNSLDRLGRAPMQAILAMGGFRITNLGAPIGQTDGARLADLGTYLPAGALQFFAMSAAPTGWLICDGTAVSRTTYAALFTAIGTLYGVGDGSTTFNLPDARGAGVRVWDNGKGRDPARVFGSYQADMFASHTHTQVAHTHGITDPTHTHTTTASPSSINCAAGGITIPQFQAATTGASATGITINNATATENATGGTETVGKNLAFQLCIRT